MARFSGSSLVEGMLIDWSLDQPADPPGLLVELLSREQVAAELQRRHRRQAMDAAYEAELIMRLGELTPGDGDRAPGTPGARRPGWTSHDDMAGVSEFFASELALVLNRGRGTANHLHHRAQVWAENLPATFAALAVGELDLARAAGLADVLGHTTPELAQAVEAILLPDAVDLTVVRLDARALELLLELDAAAADQRRQQARRSADVFLQAGSDGMATLGADLPADEAAEAYAQLDELAKMAKADGDDRPIGTIRAELFSVLRRSGGADAPVVAAHLTVTATLDSLQGASTVAGSVNGLAITAGHARELLARIAALRRHHPRGRQPRSRHHRHRRAAAGRHHRRRTAAGRRQGLPRASRLWRRLPRARHAGRHRRVSPTAKQRRFVTTRDRTCRMPNCGQRVGWADLDHVIPHSCGGATSCTNLCCLCRTDHRLKTFASGWRFGIEPDGTLHVTTPTGITRTTRPPGLRRPPPRPAPPTEPDDDPPPF